MIKNITVIGAGTMGNGIAHTFAQNNFNVNLVDISSESLDKALKNIVPSSQRHIFPNHFFIIMTPFHLLLLTLKQMMI